jgi:hypothetical protein
MDDADLPSPIPKKDNKNQVLLPFSTDVEAGANEHATFKKRNFVAVDYLTELAKVSPCIIKSFF